MTYYFCTPVTFKLILLLKQVHSYFILLQKLTSISADLTMFFFAELSSAVCLLLTIGKKTDNQKIFRENTTVTIVVRCKLKSFSFVQP